MKMIKNYLKRPSITLLLLVFLSFSVIISFTLLFSVVRPNYINNATKKTYSNNLTITANTASFIDQAIMSTDVFIESFNSLITNVDDINNVDLNNYFKNIFEENDYLNSIELLNYDGDVIYTYPEDENKLLLNRSNQLYFTELLFEGDKVWTKPHFSNFENELLVTTALKSEEYYIVGNINLSFFEDLYLQINDASPDKELIILDSYGIYIFDSLRNSEIYQNKFEQFDDLLSIQDPDTPFIIDLFDDERIVTNNIAHTTEWTVIIHEKLDTSQIEANRIFNVMIIYTIGILLLFAYSLIHIMHIITTRLKRINETLLEVSNGNYNNRIHNLYYKEFSKIGDQFNLMSISLKESNEKLLDLAFNDELTGLKSRNYIKLYLQDFITNNKKSNITFFYLDITRFRVINESYGYDFGDNLLKSIANRLNSMLENKFEIVRIDSDEFLIVYESQDNPNYDKIQKKVNDVFFTPFTVQGIEVLTFISIGIANYPEHAASFDGLITSCLVALGEAKNQLEQNYFVFENYLIKEFDRKVAIEVSIDNALLNDEFFIKLQPIVEITTGNIRGFEALSRWNHPTLKEVSPVEYIPLLETSKKIHQLDKKVVSEAIKTTKLLSRKFNNNYVISCNISVETILRNDFVDFIKFTLHKFDFNPTYLELEITESTIISDFNKVKRVISSLKAIGVRFSEDDFGDGFSSLNYLTQLDLSTLKISRSFLNDVHTNVNKRLLIATIIKLSKDLGFETIAEGVEDKETLKIFEDLNCNFVQGFYFYRPLTYTQLEKALEDEVKKIG